MRLLIGVDIGGTFTDVVAFDEQSQQVFATKVSSTPPDLVHGFVNGVTRILEVASAQPDDVQRVIHGTTIATNAVLERRGARIGILTTAGFEDTLVIGRQKRSAMYDLFVDAGTPVFLAPRQRVKGIRERLDYRGNTVIALDEKDVQRAVAELVEQHQIEALAVSYLFSFIDPAHERRTREIVRAAYPDLPVSLSSTIDPKFREYERLVLTAFDAYVRPVIGRYVGRLRGEFERLGTGAEIQIMQSRGGITSAETVLEKPVATLLSGPAAGVIGGTYVGESVGTSDLITVDIGGTSCDVALVHAGKPLVSSEGQIDRYPLRQPMVDVNTIGAGGGSIAWIDAGGGLRVGPQSAGSSPGPACYGWGGEQPTVTDASVVLGYLNPRNFAGGSLALDAELAEQAIRTRVAEPLGMETTRAADGIHRIINSRMADELRLVSIRRGYDPRHFTLVALGGAGPVHAGRLADLLGIPRVVVPTTPGVLSAFGLLVADIEHEHARTLRARADQVSPNVLAEIFAELSGVCLTKMRRDQVPESAVRERRFAELRYVGQSWELEVPFPEGDVNEQSVATAVAAFHVQHARVYGHASESNPVEFVNLRTVLSHSLPRPHFAPKAGAVSAPGTPREHRPAYFEEYAGFVNTPVYDKADLTVGVELRGPGIIEQLDTTTVLYPGHRGHMDQYGNFLVTTAAATDRPLVQPTLGSRNGHSRVGAFASVSREQRTSEGDQT